MENSRKDKRLFAFLYKIVMPATIRKFNIKTEDIPIPDGPCLILSNHVTDLDPVFVSHAIGGRQSYFVCADAIMRKPIAKWLISSIFNPITHVKGKVGLATVAAIMKALKEGENVSLFPEGNRSFDGRTATMTNVIGKLAKKSKANLVLIRLEGGYFTQPRWGTTFRKGRLIIKNGGVYTKEQLETMSVDEITEAINRGIYTDAYDEQEENRCAYKGKHLCLGMEAGIYKCPKCGAVGTLKSDDSRIFCDCGYSETLNEYGYLVDADGNEHRITLYMDQQRQMLKELVESKTDKVLFEDETTIVRVSENYVISDEERISLKAYYDHVDAEIYKSGVFKDGKWLVHDDKRIIRIDHTNLEAMSIFSRNKITIYLKDDPTAYEVRGNISFNALKYRDLYELTDK